MTFWTKLLFIAALPILILMKLFMLPFERPVRKSHDEVASVLRRFIDGHCSDEDWDDFVCVPIEDEHLDNIRKQASEIDEITSTEVENRLRKLLSDVELAS